MKLLRKAKYSAETIYLYAGFKQREKFEKALQFHNMKVAITVGLLILVCQLLLVWILKLV